MIKKILSAGLLSATLLTSLHASEVLAIVNGKNITTEVAPKDFNKLDKETQAKIVDRLINKRVAADYALSTKTAHSKKFEKVLEHVLNIDKPEDKTLLKDVFASKKTLKGYTKEQLYSKKGLLAFDFLVNDQAEKIKIPLEKQKEYYKKNKFKYDTPATKELLTIVVKDKETAEKILKELASSKDILQSFSSLAKKYSLAPSASNSGYFGKIAVYELNDTLKPHIKDLKRTEYTKEPIKTEFGYQIFYILNDIPEFDSKFDLVKTKIESEMMQKAVKEWAMNKVESLRKKATVKIVQ
jgi:parvulin-like peptidyl-prolyl isomerase